ncbi:MAG: hypothetical protein JNJ45_06620 [Chthonomonas sp.]|nr:hypothetical protein [Chthonomonas sp.]
MSQPEADAFTIKCNQERAILIRDKAAFNLFRPQDKLFDFPHNPSLFRLRHGSKNFIVWSLSGGTQNNVLEKGKKPYSFQVKGRPFIKEVQGRLYVSTGGMNLHSGGFNFALYKATPLGLTKIADTLSLLSQGTGSYYQRSDGYVVALGGRSLKKKGQPLAANDKWIFVRSQDAAKPFAYQQLKTGAIVYSSDQISWPSVFTYGALIWRIGKKDNVRRIMFFNGTESTVEIPSRNMRVDFAMAAHNSLYVILIDTSGSKPRYQFYEVKSVGQKLKVTTIPLSFNPFLTSEIVIGESHAYIIDDTRTLRKVALPK